MQEMITDIEKADITTKSYGLNADAGFDTATFKVFCKSEEMIGNIDINERNGQDHYCVFDEILYKHRFVIERTNAWLDGLKALLVRFETHKIHWKELNLLAFTSILTRQL